MKKSRIFFTSDQHFDHTRVIQYSKRPFRDLEHMQEELIRRHNEVVRPGDRVYHLGDFSFKDPTPFLSRLNGTHYLLHGNHDRDKLLKDPQGFVWVKQQEGIRVDGKYIFLSHFPHLSWNQSRYGAWHLHGHVHGLRRDGYRRIDVGVDCWNYYPVSLETIKLEIQAHERFGWVIPGCMGGWWRDRYYALRRKTGEWFAQVCPHCGGIGEHPQNYYDQQCSHCKGTGVLPRWR